jgi:hypothetical protein
MEVHPQIPLLPHHTLLRDTLKYIIITITITAIGIIMVITIITTIIMCNIQAVAGDKTPARAVVIPPIHRHLGVVQKVVISVYI